MIVDLVDLGADRQSFSGPFRSHMPDGIQGKACTPQEAAAAQSVKRERNYLDALQEADWDRDHGFWEAVENLV